MVIFYSGEIRSEHVTPITEKTTQITFVSNASNTCFIFLDDNAIQVSQLVIHK